MSKAMVLQWLINVCLCFIPVYGVFGLACVYGYAVLGKYNKRYKAYLVAAIILALLIVANLAIIYVIQN